MKEIKDIYNVMIINERLASSGQPEEMDFKFIAKSGYQYVINLAMPNSDNAIPEEGYIVTARKMSYVHIPVPWEAPEQDHLDQFFMHMQAMKKRKLWIHCAMNYRVSAFLYHYFYKIEGWSKEQAQQVMLPSWKPNNVWQEFLSL